MHQRHHVAPQWQSCVPFRLDIEPVIELLPTHATLWLNGSPICRARLKDEGVETNLDFPPQWPSFVPCRLKDKGVGRDGEWGSLLGKPPLLGASAEDSATLSHLLSLFVQRHWLLWKVGALGWCAGLVRLGCGCCTPVLTCCWLCQWS